MKSLSYLVNSKGKSLLLEEVHGRLKPSESWVAASRPRAPLWGRRYYPVEARADRKATADCHRVRCCLFWLRPRSDRCFDLLDLRGRVRARSALIAGAGRDCANGNASDGARDGDESRCGAESEIDTRARGSNAGADWRIANASGSANDPHEK